MAVTQPGEGPPAASRNQRGKEGSPQSFPGAPWLCQQFDYRFLLCRVRGNKVLFFYATGFAVLCCGSPMNEFIPLNLHHSETGTIFFPFH